MNTPEAKPDAISPAELWGFVLLIAAAGLIAIYVAAS
jgi:hypothetical protein